MKCGSSVPDYASAPSGPPEAAGAGAASRITQALHPGYRKTGDTVRAFKSIPSIALALTALLAPSPGRAQSPAEFYKGKSIELTIGTSVGGGYDSYGRMLARS